MKSLCFVLVVLSVFETIAFSSPCHLHRGMIGKSSSTHTIARKNLAFHLSMTSKEQSVDDGVVELVDEDDRRRKDC